MKSHLELPDKILHEWEQSTKEPMHIIKGLTLEGQTVLDPFCGAGRLQLLHCDYADSLG